MQRRTILKKSITEPDTDVVVNAANDGLWAGSGVCGAIFSAAGHKQLQAACDKIGHCDVGSAVITPGFNLKSKYIIHAVGPIWKDGKQNEPDLLYSAYYKSLELAVENDCHSIGFPLLSAGIFGYPVKDAWHQAIKACTDFQHEHPANVISIVFAVLDDRILNVGLETIASFDKESETTESIQYTFFWHEYDENGQFSNWYPSQFTVEGVSYKHVEQFIMAQKAKHFGDDLIYRAIMRTDDPSDCKKLGKRVTGFDSLRWDLIRYPILRAGVRAKFGQDPKLRALLLNTGDAILAEASPYDKVFGIGLDAATAKGVAPDQWPGENLLGKVLMEVRRELRNKEEEEPLFSVIDEYESSIRFVDQPGQWIDITPPAVKKRQRKVLDELAKELHEDKNDE